MDFIQQMLDKLRDGKGWTKGQLKRSNQYNTRYCLYGAAAAVRDDYHYVYGSKEYWGLWYKDYAPALEAIGNVIEEQYGSPCHSIPVFNDHVNTKWEDVRTVLEKAQVKLNERL